MVEDLPRADGTQQPGPTDAAPLIAAGPRPFYDASPELVNDIARGPGTLPASGAAPADAATAPTGEQSADKPAATAAPVEASPLLNAPYADPVMPYGAEVGLELTRAAGASGMTPEEASETGQHWAAVMFAHGIPDREAMQLSDAGLAVARGDLNEETTEGAWVREANERMSGEFGGPENAARVLALARRYVQAHPALNDFLTNTRLGNHPCVVVALANVAHRSHRAGKFQ